MQWCWHPTSTRWVGEYNSLYATLTPQLPLLLHFMICHSKKCHRPRTSSCHREQRGGTIKKPQLPLLVMHAALLRGYICEPDLASASASPVKLPSPSSGTVISMELSPSSGTFSPFRNFPSFILFRNFHPLQALSPFNPLQGLSASGTFPLSPSSGTFPLQELSPPPGTFTPFRNFPPVTLFRNFPPSGTFTPFRNFPPFTLFRNFQPLQELSYPGTLNQHTCSASCILMLPPLFVPYLLRIYTPLCCAQVAPGCRCHMLLSALLHQTHLFAFLLWHITMKCNNENRRTCPALVTRLGVGAVACVQLRSAGSAHHLASSSKTFGLLSAPRRAWCAWLNVKNKTISRYEQGLPRIINKV